MKTLVNIARQNERLIVLLIIAVFALNYPLLSLFSKKTSLLGIPILFLYLFVFWGLFILLMALVLRKRDLAKKSNFKTNQTRKTT